jgi:hypothetical protein
METWLLESPRYYYVLCRGVHRARGCERPLVEHVRPRDNIIERNVHISQFKSNLLFKVNLEALRYAVCYYVRIRCMNVGAET